MEAAMKRLCGAVVAVFSLYVSIGPLYGAEKFRAASGGFSTAIHSLLWVAYEKKIFNKYGLDVEYIALESGTTGMQTLLANEVQVLFSTGALGITANLQGADVTIVAGGINFIPNKLVVRPEIPQLVATLQSREDLPRHIIKKILCENPRTFYQL